MIIYFKQEKTNLISKIHIFNFKIINMKIKINKIQFQKKVKKKLKIFIKIKI